MMELPTTSDATMVSKQHIGANHIPINVDTGDRKKSTQCKAKERKSELTSNQLKVYNYLERPKGWKCLIYHLIIFVVIVLCLVLSALSTVSNKSVSMLSVTVLFYTECALLLFFAFEYMVRVWSAGCRSIYMGFRGRLKFAMKPILIIDLFILLVSLVILISAAAEQNGKDKATNACTDQLLSVSAVRAFRFMQILRMLHVDRQGRTWKLLGSVVYLHQQELITTLYIGFLGLIFASYFVYLAERESKLNADKQLFNSYSDALWWGLITMTTIGYGDIVPQTWPGRMVASCFILFVISFFALPAGILGSGFALKVQQKQRQKHFNQQIPVAAAFIQCMWRCHAAETKADSASWHIHTITKSKHHTAHTQPQATSVKLLSSALINAGTGIMLLKPNTTDDGPQTQVDDTDTKINNNNSSERAATSKSKDATINTIPTAIDTNKNSSNINHIENLRPKLTAAERNAIKAIRRLQYFVAKRKFQAARKPYDVRDVIDQYSQGHLNMVIRIKELQRRLDQTLGKPFNNLNRNQLRQKMSIAARLTLLEKNIISMQNNMSTALELINQLSTKLKMTKKNQPSDRIELTRSD